MASQIARALPPGTAFFKDKPRPDNGRLVRGLKRAGKKIAEWDRIRADLKKRFARVGILHCELNYSGCWRTTALGFAHSKKRADCSKADLRIVILSCNICHDVIEVKPKAEMEKIVLKVILKRKIQP